MPELEEVSLSFAAGGMNAALNPANLPEEQYARAVNVQLIKQRPSTRRGVRVLPFVDTKESTKTYFQEQNFQGAMFYNPAKGQSAISFVKDGSRIMASVGGKRYQVIPKTVQTGINNVIVEEVKGLQDGDKNFHMAWWYQAENYAIVQDGQSNAWVWPGAEPPFFTDGLNTVDKEKSELASGATAGAYVHGRIVQVVNSNNVIVGDIIHKLNQTNASNILDTTEQLYWATGAAFLPPSSMGNILALGFLPLRDTAHGHGTLMVHCEDGIFSINLNIFPRTLWEDSDMVKHVLLETGARGPYALALYDGDQFFRSRHGLQSLRSAAGESQLLGNPLNPISEEVNVWLNNDYEAFVIFTSLGKWAVERRLFTTVDPWVQGRYRGSRGVVSLNFAPIGSLETDKAWEGLMTFPPEICSPIQMVNGVFNGRDRMYMIAAGEDGKNRVVEFSQDLKNDVLEDGSESRISCQIQTKALVGGNLFKKSERTFGTLYLTNVEGILDWGVWLRSNECDNWVFWRKGRECVKSEVCCEEDFENCDLRGFCQQEFELNLGTLPDEMVNVRKIQALIRWRGVASIEAIKFKYNMDSDPNESSGPVAGSDKCPKKCLEVRLDCEYNDYEYSFSENRWEDKNGS